ncbi:MAG: Galactokinase [Ilumatobacteraceae bacterium]|nr:Galactokinase [Ilumatobacteraceae bacterium]
MRVRAPGRVNLIGDHTDYTGGLVLPMAIDRWTDITYRPHPTIELSSDDEPEPVLLPLAVDDPASTQPGWGRYVAGVVAELRPSTGIVGTITTDIPIGAGLSSSAALEVAVALALGADMPAVELAELCRRAEHRASGVPSGIMDQLSIAASVAGHALMIDCGELSCTPVRMPDDVDVVVQFVAHRTLISSPYADRVADCTAAEREIGPLRTASLDDVATIRDPVVRARAHHVVSENQRVRQFADALASGDLRAAGTVMLEGHASLRDLYDTSTPVMDAAVAHVAALPGVYGARMTGGGFGGCLVALVAPGTAIDGWIVRPVDGAHIIDASTNPTSEEPTGKRAQT